MVVHSVLLVLALVFFLVGTFAPSPPSPPWWPISWIALGLAFLAAAFLFGGGVPNLR